ncbi:MAG TPA: caspase family protein [Bryobacteraceae bacterium]|nr:caspase family protein [Bryobacteraceae bacterium]
MRCGLPINRAKLGTLLLAAQLIAWGQVPPAAPAQQAAAPQQKDLTGRDISITKTGPSKPTQQTVPRGYALIIGVSKYKLIDPAQNLQFPETDAEGIYRALISKEAGAFPAENVHTLIGPTATKERIKFELENWLAKVAQPSDTVVVFFAGHGFAVDGRGYFAPYDVDPNDVTNTGYSMADFGRTLETKVRATNKVLLVDACRSGKVSRGLVEQDPGQVNADLGKLSNSFLTFVAAREQDRSYEDPKLGSGAGLFSYFVTRGLDGDADLNCDGFVTADELIEYVRTNVRQYAREHGVSQTPTDYGDFEPKLVLAISHRCGSALISSEVNDGELVVEGNMDGIDIYLDDKAVGTVSTGKPLKLSGIPGGVHTVMGVRKGYETDTKQATVIPGQSRAVSIRIQYAREYKKQSMNYMQDGEKLLFNHRSSFNPLAVYAPGQQNAKTYQEAADLFQKALKEDDRNARAAYDLGLADLYLSKDADSLGMLKKAVTLDPTYVEAKTQYAGQLIESGDPDEAIRQLTDALRMDPKNDLALTYLSRAYYDKGVLDRSVQSADQALAVKPNNAEAYLWKGAALRLTAAQTKDQPQKLALYQQSCDAFNSFLKLTNFSSPAYAQALFYLSPIPGLGHRSHADRTDSWKLQRGIALEGLCDGQNHMEHSIQANGFCAEAIQDDPSDPVAYYLMGHVHRDLFGRTHAKDELLLARDNYQKVVRLNPDLDISKNARNYLDQIQALLEKLAMLTRAQ